MADEQQGMDDAALAAAARHALHDEELVAAYAAGGLESDDDTAQARSLVERCAVCRDLHRDIAAIGTALATEARFTTSAPRDFRLTVDDAERLGGRVRPPGLVAAVRRSVLAFARPVGATLTAFGLVGVLVGATSFGGAGSALLAGPTGGGPWSAPAEYQSTDTQPDGPKASGDTALVPAASGSTGRTNTDPPIDRDRGWTGLSPIAWLLAGSVAILLAGVLLLIVSFRRDGSGRVRG